MGGARSEVQLSLGQLVQQFAAWVRPRPTFVGGVHPPQHKDLTADAPIRQFPFAPVMNVLLSQHIGKPSLPVVREGQEVTRGQLLAKPDGFLSVALHAPASGIVERIGLMPSIRGKMEPGIYLKPFPGDTQMVSHGRPCALDGATPQAIRAAIQMAGIVGLGGAGFPTHAKLTLPQGQSVDTLIINGAECEPYLTNDYRIMLEQPGDVLVGIGYLLKACGAKRAIIGIEDNKPAAAEALNAALATLDDVFRAQISVKLVATKYPQGAEKMLVTALTGRQVPPGKHSYSVGTLMVNVTSAAEVGRLLPAGEGIQERVITISGPGVEKPGNYRIPLGTPLRFALDYVGVSKRVSQVYLGGPMMGQALPNLDIPITKGVSGFIAFANEHIRKSVREYPCIHCGYCVDACPMHLNPSQLGLHARKGEYQEMVERHHLKACFECGSCAFVCPSHIPLVQEFRIAKAQAKKLERHDAMAIAVREVS